MKIDFTNLLKATQEDIDSNKSSDQGGNGYPIVYTGENGKLTIRLLYNMKAGIVQRMITRHDSGKGKIPCLQAYGEECPVCSAISSVEAVKGKEIGAFRKYGFKKRGFCFAKIIDHEATYFRGENDPKKGDVVMLMYPKTVYDQISKIIFEAGSDNIDKILSNNDGIPIIIERSQKKGGFPEYSVHTYSYGSVKAFNEPDGDKKFEELLESLPDLNESIVPAYPNEEVRNSNKALADTIIQEYMNSNIVNPGDTVKSEPKEPAVSNAAAMVSSTVTTNDYVSEDGDKPDCFGKYDDSSKCLVCPHDQNCYLCSDK